MPQPFPELEVPMRRYVSRVLVVAAAALALPVVVVHSPSPQPAHASSYKEGAAVVVRRVEARKVCMINDQYLSRDQIPVEVDGKIYYGCCPMCKTRLKKDPTTRYAVDPVSGKKVDKALAVIGVTPDGTAYYFENESNLERFSQSLKRLR